MTPSPATRRCSSSLGRTIWVACRAPQPSACARRKRLSARHHRLRPAPSPCRVRSATVRFAARKCARSTSACSGSGRTLPVLPAGGGCDSQTVVSGHPGAETSLAGASAHMPRHGKRVGIKPTEPSPQCGALRYILRHGERIGIKDHGQEHGDGASGGKTRPGAMNPTLRPPLPPLQIATMTGAERMQA
jgi:hypothetical protein